MNRSFDGLDGVVVPGSVQDKTTVLEGGTVVDEDIAGYLRNDWVTN